MELFAADGHDAGGCERVTGKSGMRPCRLHKFLPEICKHSQPPKLKHKHCSSSVDYLSPRGRQARRQHRPLYLGLQLLSRSPFPPLAGTLRDETGVERRPPRVHPRVCGEALPGSRAAGISAGPSPRVRGSRVRQRHVVRSIHAPGSRLTLGRMVSASRMAGGRKVASVPSRRHMTQFGLHLGEESMASPRSERRGILHRT